jgi:hypothetical protein
MHVAAFCCPIKTISGSTKLELWRRDDPVLIQFEMSAQKRKLELWHFLLMRMWRSLIPFALSNKMADGP